MSEKRQLIIVNPKIPKSCEHCGDSCTKQAPRVCDYCGCGMCFDCTEEHDEQLGCPGSDDIPRRTL